MLSDFVARLRRSAEATGQTIEDPDGDWPPTLVVDGERSAVANLGPWMTDSASKDRLASRLPAILALSGARQAGMVLPAWYRSDVPDHESERVAAQGLAADPQRQECVVVQAASAEGAETWLAPVLRDGVRPPQLGPWEALPDGPVDRFGGALRAGFGGRRR